MNILLYKKYISNKHLLYSTGNYTELYLIFYNLGGKRSEKYIHIYIYVYNMWSIHILYKMKQGKG